MTNALNIVDLAGTAFGGCEGVRLGERERSAERGRS